MKATRDSDTSGLLVILVSPRPYPEEDDIRLVRGPRAAIHDPAALRSLIERLAMEIARLTPCAEQRADEREGSGR